MPVVKLERAFSDRWGRRGSPFPQEEDLLDRAVGRVLSLAIATDAKLHIGTPRCQLRAPLLR